MYSCIVHNTASCFMQAKGAWGESGRKLRLTGSEMTIKQEMGKLEEINRNFYGQISQLLSWVECHWAHVKVARRKRVMLGGSKGSRVDLGVTHNSELRKDLAPSCTAGAGTGARWIPCITELDLKHSSHPCTVFSNNLDKLQNEPLETVTYTQMLCQMQHLVVVFWSWHFWSQAQTGSRTMPVKMGTA